MKDSDVPWLGKVPRHWEVARLKRICRLQYGDSLPADVRQEGMVPVFGSNGRVGFHSRPNTKAPSIVVGRKGSFGKVNFSAEPVFAIDTTFFVDGRYTSADVRWLAYLLGWMRLDEVSKDSAVPGLDREDAYQRPAVLPPLAEQAAIVRFLDDADRRIRRYIAAKKKLVALLNEQKQATIHRVVTRGLDPNVRLKPSGVEWLGDVPEHWEVRRLGRLGRVFNGTTPSRAQSAYWSNGTIPWLSSSKVNERLITAPSELITARALRECGLSLVPSGSLVMGLIGQGRTRGMCALLAIDACISQNLVAVVAGSVLSGEFLYYALISSYKGIRELGRGGNQAALNCEIVGRLPIPVPPMKEQAAICEALKTQIAGLVLLEHRPDREIALLREYRTRLIADVVTGKLDVRGAAARLPDEINEPEPLDDVDVEADGDESGDGADLDAVPRAG
jgi:type I restriction enzyme S subunit